MKKNQKNEGQVDILSLDIQQVAMAFRLVGTTPLYMHRLSAKARKELLYPTGRKNKAERAATMKHDPLEEYRECFYKCRDPHAPTFVHLPAGAFKRALATASLDLPGTTKAAIARQTAIGNETIHIYGVPRLRADIVRDSSVNRTPDVRIRPCFETWACEITIEHVSTLIPSALVEKLLICAGMFVGVGDFRQEKGAGNFGKWRVVESADDAEFAEIVATGGYEAQRAAYETPIYYDEETEELIAWFYAERQTRTTGVRTKSMPMLVAKEMPGKRGENGVEALV